MRQHGREIDRQSGCTHAALGAQKCVNLAELALRGHDTLRSTLEPCHRIPEIGAAHRLHDEIVRPEAHRLNDRLAVGVVVGNDDIQVGHRLLKPLQRLEARLGVPRQVNNNRRIRMPFDILHHTDI